MASGTTTGLAGRAAAEDPGEGAAHAALFERVIERVYRYFRRTVWDAGEAEECAQRTLLALERSLREGSYVAGHSFNTWIWMKAHQVFVDWCRERGRRMEPLSERGEVPARATDGLERRLDAEAVLRAVASRLGLESYECFVLRYQGGLTLDEVAAAVGRDRKTVTARIRAAHGLIDRMLGKEGAP
jgi:RNA polymerase sigma-70 factor (ECF subfamily)